MHAVFADPKTDFVFKRIFGAETRKSLLIALLNNLLEFEGDRQIVGVQHLTGEQHVDIAELNLRAFSLRNVRLDATAHDGGWTVKRFTGGLPGDRTRSCTSSARRRTRRSSTQSRPAPRNC